MNSSRAFALWLYARCLRLYPPQFRAEFADEMVEVFRLKLEASDTHFSSLVPLLAELRDLLLSVVRAQLFERRRLAGMMTEAGVMMESSNAMRTFRWAVWASLAIFAAYVLLLVMPFFALGLHQQPVEAVRYGAFDPKGYGFYSGDGTYPNSLLILTGLMMLVGPIWEVIWGGVLFLSLWKYRPHFSSRQRLLAGLALVASTSVVAFMFSPLGRLIFAWYLD
ncbi:MAG: hypothetical protein K8I30_14755 [Anaerolineae bacterium]|nr:hypothetical protein [Anaerolineae bacterium]